LKWARAVTARELIAGVVLGVAHSACVEPDPYDGYGAWPPSGLDVAELTIDASESLSLASGEGIGVGAEYAGDGVWAVTTVCDTALSDADCFFDILITSDGSAAGVDEITGSDLESDDEFFSPDPFAVQLEFVTGADADGATFTTSPGATVRLSALLYDPVLDSDLDWADDPRLISWVGNGAIHRGAPTNPVDLTPNRP
jgi:hypothetical protein